MELDIEVFVSSILDQISSAIESNSHVLKKPDKNSPIPGIGYVYHENQHGWTTKVDFDIAVTTFKGKDGKAKLSVAGIGIGGDAKSSEQIVSRIKYSVPLQFLSKR